MIKKILYLLLIVPMLSFAGDCERLTVSSNPEYPPFLWQTNTQPVQLKGVLVSFMQRLSDVTGIKIDMVYAGPWLRVQSQVRTGSLDIIAVFHTEDRTHWLDYLHPEVIKTDTAIWVNKANIFEFKHLEDLKNRSGLAVMGHSLGQDSDDYIDKNLTISEVSSVQQGLKMLEEQRADYLMYARAPGQSYAQQLNTKDVVTLPTPVSSEQIYLAFSKQSKCNTSANREKLTAALEQAKRENWAIDLVVQAQGQWLQNSNNK